MLEDMSYTIRAAVDADVPAIADIYNEAVIRGGASADLEPVSLESRRAWVDSHQPRAKYPVVVIKGPEGAVVGFGSLSKFHQRAGYDGIAELSYYIAGDHQRQGLGTMMVRWLIDAAAERGTACWRVCRAPTISLSVRTTTSVWPSRTRWTRRRN